MTTKLDAAEKYFNRQKRKKIITAFMNSIFTA